MSYTALAVAGVAFAIALDLAVLRTRLLTRRIFWTSYGIIVLFQLIANGILTGAGIVVYSPHAILGPRVVYAPVEDLLFGFSLVTQTLAWWVWWGRRSPTRPDQADRPRRGRTDRPVPNRDSWLRPDGREDSHRSL